MRLKISELAHAAGVGVETIRYYHRRNLLELPDKIGGFRKYGEEHLSKIQFLKEAQYLGFQLDEAAELLSYQKKGGRYCISVEKKCREKIIEIDSRIQRLTEIKEALNKLQVACSQNRTLSSCPILIGIKKRASEKGGENDKL